MPRTVLLSVVSGCQLPCCLSVYFFLLLLLLSVFINGVSDVVTKFCKGHGGNWSWQRIYHALTELLMPLDKSWWDISGSELPKDMTRID